MDDRITVIALTTPLGLYPAERGNIIPLRPAEWSRLSSALFSWDLQLDDLYDADPWIQNVLEQIDRSFPIRIRTLLERRGVVERAAHDLKKRGIWIATDTDWGYPSRWIATLGDSRPPLVYGTGNPDLVNLPAIGIVGSRDISGDLVEIANDLGAAAVCGGYSVVSGGARGTDRIGMTGAFEVRGTVVGILPDHLQRERLRRVNHNEIGSGRLTFLSIVHPDTPFTVGNAMGRNRLIYAFAELTIVIATSEGKGGTWAGAVDNLKYRWAPIAVWTGAHAPAANRHLVERGAMALGEIPDSSEAIHSLVSEATTRFEKAHFEPAKPATLQLGFLPE